MSLFRLKLLGGFSVSLADQPITSFYSDKTRALLAYLVCEANRPHHRESLTGLFWPEKPENLARHSLSQAMHILTATFEDHHLPVPFILTRQWVQFQRNESIWIDVWEFDEQTEPVARLADTGWIELNKVHNLEKALDLYQGDFMAGFSLPGCIALEDWLRLKREEYHQKAIQGLGKISTAWELRGESDQALVYARKLVQLDPLNEDGRGRIIQILMNQDLRIEAIKEYHDLRNILQDELSVQPGPDITALYQAVLETANHKTIPTPRYFLPASLTPLVGRQQELETICSWLANADCRLVTLLGMGGVGKTRLAQEVGRKLVPLFSEGVVWVELDTQQAGQALVSLILQALNIEQSMLGTLPVTKRALPPEVFLAQALGDKHMLLILDGFEAILEQANLISQILRQAGQIKILATSRARLNLASEKVFILEGLTVPSRDIQESELVNFGAASLFQEAARRVQPDFRLTVQNRSAVIEICQLTQGLPLGLLLAAGWISALSVEQTAVEIQHNLQFLSSDWTDLPDRHRNLYATFDYSWQRLPASLQTSLLRLSIFRGTFNLERAWQVTGTDRHAMKLLLDQALVQHAGNSRYRLHDLICQYAQEKLARLPEENRLIHEEHCLAYLESVSAWERRLKSADQPAALAEMNQDETNLRAAWEWAVEQEHIDLLEKAANGLGYFYELRYRSIEGSAIFGEAVRRLTTRVLVQRNILCWSRLANWWAIFLCLSQAYTRALEVIQGVQEAIAKAREQPQDLYRELACACLTRGDIEYFVNGPYQEMINHYQKAVELMHKSGDAWDYSLALGKLADGYRSIGNLGEITRLSNEAMLLQSTLNDPHVLNLIRFDLQWASILAGQSEEGLRLATQQYNELRDSTLDPQKAQGEYYLGSALMYAGLFTEARFHLQQAMEIYNNIEGNRSANYRNAQRLFIMNAVINGNYKEAQHLVDLTWDDLSELDQARLSLAKARLLSMTGQDQKAELVLRKGLELFGSEVEDNTLGVFLALHAWIAFRQGKPELARQRIIAALENFQHYGIFNVAIASLAPLARILAEHGQIEQAVELYTVVMGHPMAAQSMWYEDVFGRDIHRLAQSLPAEVRQVAQARGRKRKLGETAIEWLDLLKRYSWDRN